TLQAACFEAGPHLIVAGPIHCGWSSTPPRCQSLSRSRKPTDRSAVDSRSLRRSRERVRAKISFSIFEEIKVRMLSRPGQILTGHADECAGEIGLTGRGA